VYKSGKAPAVESKAPASRPPTAASAASASAPAPVAAAAPVAAKAPVAATASPTNGEGAVREKEERRKSIALANKLEDEEKARRLEEEKEVRESR